MKENIGTYNYVSKQQALKNIEMATSRFKRNKISTEEFISDVHKSLQMLTDKRDYWKYLDNIGQ